MKLTTLYDTEAHDDCGGEIERYCDHCDVKFRRSQTVYIGSYNADTGSSHYCRSCAVANAPDEIARSKKAES